MVLQPGLALGRLTHTLFSQTNMFDHETLSWFYKDIEAEIYDIKPEADFEKNIILCVENL